MSALDLIGLGLSALPGITNVFESNRRRENPPEVGRASGTREGSVSFINGNQPQGGFSVSPFIQQQIQGLERQPETVKGGLFNLFDVANPAAGQVRNIQDQLAQTGGRLTQSQVQDFAQQLRALGKNDLASELVFQAGRQSGGTNIDPGVRELIQAGQVDVQQAQNLADRDFSRQLEALGTLKQSQSLLPELRNSASTQFGQALTDSRNAENRTLRNIRGGRLEAFLPLLQAQKIRDEVNARFDPEQGAVAALESQREGLDAKHTQELSDLRNRLAADPSFTGQPALVENEVRKLQFAQRNELGTLQNGIRADFAKIAADVDLQTASFVTNAAAQTAGGLGNLRQLQAQANDAFQSRRTTISLNKVANDVQIGILEKQGMDQEANFLRTMTELFVPTADLVRQAFAVNLQLEDRQLAVEQGTFQQQQNGFAQIGSAVSQFQAQKAAQDAQKEAEQGSFGGLGSAAGTAVGALLAIPTGGLSIAAGATLGGGLGGAAGGLIKN